MVRVLAFLLLVTNIFSQEGGASNSSAEQDTMSLDSTIPSTAPVAVVEGFKVVLREGRIPGRKKRYSKMRLTALDAKLNFDGNALFRQTDLLDLRDDDEEDPRAELIRRLQEYERYKDAAEKLDKLPRYERDIFSTIAEFPGRKIHHKPPEVALESIFKVFSEVLERADMFSHHMVQREVLSVRERMGIVLEKIDTETFIDFKDLFTAEEGRAGAIVSLLAILQLMKDSLIQLVQNETNGPIYVKAAS